MFKLSIIIPVYNAQKKIEKAIFSIINQTMDIKDIEVIFIDDCSNDLSVQIIQKYCNIYPNFKLIQLEQNSGSPSRPRNYGIKEANSQFIVFLDSDDVLLENACQLLYTEASKNNCDIVRGYLRVVKDGKIFYTNRLHKADYTDISGKELIKKLIANQSTTVDGIFRRDFLLSNNITFNENIRLGEDTLFLSECYAKTTKVHYTHNCIYEYIKRDELNNVSSTQSYGARELNDHLTVWTRTRKILKEAGLDYFKLRLHMGFKTALENMLNFSNGLIPEDSFNDLRRFLIENKFIVPSMKLNKRLTAIVENIIEGNYNAFVKNTRKRVLINGYDLKFIKPLIPFLKQRYEVEIDEWQGHDRHDERKSKELLNWADVVICEWLLGNAVWYSKNKLEHQLLFIRMHRFELFGNYGKLINKDRVDCFIAVGMYYYEEFVRNLDLPRSKMKLIGNHVDYERFNKAKQPNSYYNLAVIGGLPKRKRIDLAVDVLEKLLELDPKFKLHIIGSKAEETPWLWKIEEERKYYEDIYQRISNSEKLKNSVIFTGWQDSAEYLKKIGFVLSVSDYHKPESFHLAPAEGMASGAVGLLMRWPGVEYIYPSEFLVSNTEEMVNRILELKDEKLFFELCNKAKTYIRESYEIENVASQFVQLIERGYLRRN